MLLLSTCDLDDFVAAYAAPEHQKLGSGIDEVWPRGLA
tara:strand:- start:40713 stop:40826 length:114 start_codon:yes stop_codon:yes gene_type:complete